MSVRSCLAVLLIAGCASRPANPVAEPAPPWQQAVLASSDVPAVLSAEWSKAANRDSCAPLAFAAYGDGEDAVARAATFSGGWGVAWDRPQLRSAFGIAGAGVSAWEGGSYAWPDTIAWSDGSSAGYGPEGGTGPNQLAYVRIRGQQCLYNVWSRLGREHLEYLLSQLRFVAHH